MKEALASSKCALIYFFETGDLKCALIFNNSTQYCLFFFRKEAQLGKLHSLEVIDAMTIIKKNLSLTCQLCETKQTKADWT